uniref:Zona pellucida sperm-binding protein 4 n=1 Tax=Cyclopterus lumpus TaxID=8103 RepID=A0A8C2WZW1_CYCLU
MTNPPAMKFIPGCLLAVALLGCLADAQYPKQIPQKRPRQVARVTQTFPERPQTFPERPQKFPKRPQTIPQTLPQFPRPHPSDRPLPDGAQHCLVTDDDKIPCGAPAIADSDCEAINCCFDGRRCFYGKLVTLQCTKDAQIIVVVAKDATLPNIVLESINFQAEEEKCKPVAVTSAFAIYQFPVTACGTSLREESGVFIYENRMSSTSEVLSGPSGMITRDSSYDLLIQCKYIGTSVKAVVVEVGTVPPPPPVAAFGPLHVELRLANGQCTAKGCLGEDVAYNSFYADSDFPVTKTLRDPVYVEVRLLERTDPNLILTLGRCWVTDKPEPLGFPQWDLLVDGCPYSDDPYRTSMLSMFSTTEVTYPSHHKRFVFKMFAFAFKGILPDGPSSGKMHSIIFKDKVSEPYLIILKSEYLKLPLLLTQINPGSYTGTARFVLYSSS